MKIFVTTVIRKTVNRHVTGHLFKIDWKSGKIEKSVPIPATTTTVPFWSSRGGNRGGRGICFHKGILYVGTAVTIRKYDIDLNFIGEICNTKFAGMHEIRSHNGLWITSTVHDAVFKTDYNGKIKFEWYGSSSKKLQRALNYKKRKLNLNMKFPTKNYEKFYLGYCRGERLHLNSICIKNKNVYIFSCSKNAFIRISPDEKVMFRDNTLSNSAHNCLFVGNSKILINDTKKQGLRLYNLKTKKCIKKIDTRITTMNKNIRQFTTPGWQRGLAHLNKDVYIVGTSPLTLFDVNIKTSKIRKVVQLDTDVAHCVHDLCVIKGDL